MWTAYGANRANVYYFSLCVKRLSSQIVFVLCERDIQLAKHAIQDCIAAFMVIVYLQSCIFSFIEIVNVWVLKFDLTTGYMLHSMFSRLERCDPAQGCILYLCHVSIYLFTKVIHATLRYLSCYHVISWWWEFSHYSFFIMLTVANIKKMTFIVHWWA